MAERGNAGKCQACDNGEHGREGHRADEAEEGVAADGQREQRRGHVAAAARLCDGFGADQDHRAEADDEDHEVEDPDQAGRVEDRQPRRLGILTV